MSDRTGSHTATRDQWIEHYLARGFALVALHDVSAGACSCGQRDPQHRAQAGKHPRAKGWQDRPLREPADVRAVFGAAPGANVGIVTGAASGIWVLDIDPGNGGMEGLAQLVAKYGPLPETYTVITGGGGLHYYWRLPADFEPTNSRRGRLPAGVDVRGWHGQVVAPPSVSLKGAYAPANDAAIAPPPPWLVELIRPPSYAASAPEPGGNGAGGIGGAPAGERGTAYARAAMTAVCDELAGALPGTRNETAFRCACRLRELINAGWLAEDVAWSSYIGAAQSADVPGAAFPPAEAGEVWTKAARQVGTKAAILPASSLGGEVIALTLAPFSPVGGGGPQANLLTYPALGGPLGLNGTAVNGHAVALPVLPAPAEPTMGMTGVGGLGGPPLDAADLMIAEMLDASALRLVPTPAPLIGELLDAGSLVWMIGAPGSFKSFVAISLAGAVGRGLMWMGREVTQADVVYIVAEGAAGMKLRTAAWEREYGPMEGVRFLPRPVQADERRGLGEWSVLVEACRRLRPGLVVIDTQSRVTIGLAEQDNAQMMIYVEAADRIRRATGACVLTVHHLGRVGTHARGASSIDGAQDTELRLERRGERHVLIHQDKQKERDDSGVIEIGLKHSPGGLDPVTGRDLSSLIAVPGVNIPILDEGADWLTHLAENQAKLIGVLVDHFRWAGGTKPEIRSTAAERYGLTARTSFNSAWDALIKRQIIIRVAGSQRWILADLAAQDGA